MLFLMHPKGFLTRTHHGSRVLLILATLTFAVGAYQGLWVAPVDYQQGDAYRVLFVHVPCAALSLGLFCAMAASGFIFAVWRIQVFHAIRQACAPVGAMLTLLALITGALWGKPTWGTWWIWDARLTSELILALLYVAVMMVDRLVQPPEHAAMVAAIVACIGVIDVPIVHYSVQWWQTLHQGSTVLAWQAPRMPWSMLRPLLWTLSAAFFYTAGMVLTLARLSIATAYREAKWCQQYLASQRGECR